MRSELTSVDSIGRYIAANRGKCLRPALLLLTARSVGNISDVAIRAAVGIELLQISTLLHDDVIDDSPTRRGNASVNVRWGNATAILMGDVLFTRALSLFTESDSIAIMRSASVQSRIMLEGEVAAKDLRDSPEFNEETYLDIIRRKTGAMTSLACEIGAQLNDAPEDIVEHMRSFGRELGVAFQIADDILDVTGDETVVGKPTGQDLREGNVTLPFLRALRSAPEEEANTIRAKVKTGITTDEEWSHVKEFIQTYRGVEAATEVAHQTTTVAREYLNCLAPSTARQSLQRLLGYVLRRHR